MPYDFYKSKEYREKQSSLMKENWEKGLFDFHYKRKNRTCLREGCNKVFEVKLSDTKVYCSSSCAAVVNNIKRGALSEATKLKISRALKGRKNPYKGIRTSEEEIICANPNCQKVFKRQRWMNRKFCSVKCSIDAIGSRPTSPRAARGKAGIRKDINKDIYFYSRWEANVARLFNLLKIKWIHQPETFDLKTQTYTPDFYLPEHNIYIEVKNFLGDYSKRRDERFRKLYPDLDLILILKEDYLNLEKQHSQFISNWEYSK